MSAEAGHAPESRITRTQSPAYEADVAVMQDELRSRPGILKAHEQVPGLLDDPRLDRVLRGARTWTRRLPCSITART
jgi:hypothetical protein